MGGKQTFNPIHPMSNGSTLPGLLGGTLGFYVPSTLTTGTAGGTATYARISSSSTRSTGSQSARYVES